MTYYISIAFDGLVREVAVGICHTGVVCLPDGEKSLMISLAVLTEYRRVTDRGTDRRTDRQTYCDGIVHSAR